VYPAGGLAWGIWQLLKPFVNVRTAAKVQMVMSDKKLFELIPPEHLPKEHGGTSTFEFNPLKFQKGA